MRTYSFDFIDSDGAIYACDVADCDNDADAARKARALLPAHVEAVSVNVWLGKTPVICIDRTDPQPSRPTLRLVGDSPES